MAWYSQGTQVVDFIENANGTIDFKTPAGSSPRDRTSGSRRSSRPSATRTGPTPTGARPATSPCRAPAATRSTSTRSRCRRPSRRICRHRCRAATPRSVRHDRRLRHGVRRGGGHGASGSTSTGSDRPARASGCCASRAAAQVHPRDRGPGLRPAQPQLQLAGRHADPARLLRRGVHDQGAERQDRPAPGRAAARRADGSCRCARSSASAPAGSSGRPGWRSRCSAARGTRAPRCGSSLREAASVDVEIRRGSRVVRRIRARNFAAGRTHSLNVSLPRAARRGEYTFVLRAAVGRARRAARRWWAGSCRRCAEPRYASAGSSSCTSASSAARRRSCARPRRS